MRSIFVTVVICLKNEIVWNYFERLQFNGTEVITIDPFYQDPLLIIMNMNQAFCFIVLLDLKRGLF